MIQENWLNAVSGADRLSWVMAALIVFVVVNVLAFSRRYLAGDRNALGHRRDVLLLGASLLVLVFANHFLVLLAAWVAADLLLVRLMIHGGRWAAARNAGLLALRTFGIGFLLLGGGLWLLAEGSGTASVRGIVATASGSHTASLGLVLIAVAAMAQSAAWPFHRWLMSSLNSATPVSALMHAGLVNGGGFLLVRFAPLYLARPALLHGLFVVGLITATVGTFWKLLQPDVKRMLACSTMGQMGFMLMQCGMGLFGPAVSHLCWHGLFKAYLFLNSGSVVREKHRPGSRGAATPARLVGAGLAGVLGALAFSGASGIGFSLADTSSVMSGLGFLAAAQLAFGMLQAPMTPWRLCSAPLVGAGAGSLYGLSVRLIEAILAPMHGTLAQPMDAVYAVGFLILVLGWLALNLNLPGRLETRAAWKRLYLAGLNGSRPDPRTVTAVRTTYQY